MARRFHVCIVTWELQPESGWGRYSTGLIRGLRERGVETTVLAARHAAQAAFVPEVRVTHCLSSPLGPLDRPAASLWNLAQIARHARGADLVHFFVEPYVLAATAWLPWPYLVTVHGTYGVAPLRGNAVLRRAFGRAMRRSRAVVCVSHFTRDRVRQALALDNLAVINNGLELPRSDPSAPNGEIAGDPVLLGVGALKPRKGYHVAIEAIALIRDRYPGVHYYAVGDDSDARYVGQLHEVVDRLGLSPNVTLTGRIDDAHLAALYRWSDVFVLTPVNSGSAFEGFGLAYLEANAYGKPVIGSRDCGAEDAITDGVNGILAPQSDPLAVAEGILRLLDDPESAARMGRRGREMAAERDWFDVAAEYVALYERALGC